MKLMFQYCLLFLIIISQQTLVVAQDDDEGYLTASFRITDETKTPILNVKIIFTDLNTNQVEHKTTTNGKVDIKLRIDRNYLIIVSDPGYYTKTIEIKTEIDQLSHNTAFYSDIDVTLLINCEDNPARSNILGQPVGRVIFDNYKQKFVYDYSYTQNMATLYMEEYYIRCQQAEKEKELALANDKREEELEKERINSAKVEEIRKAEIAEKEKAEIESAEQKRIEEELKIRKEAEKTEQKKLEKQNKLKQQALEEENQRKAEAEQIQKEAEAEQKIKEEEANRLKIAEDKAKQKKQDKEDKLKAKADEETRIKAENDAKIRAEAESTAKLKAEEDARIKRIAIEAAAKQQAEQEKIKKQEEELAKSKAEQEVIAEQKSKEVEAVGKDEAKEADPNSFIRTNVEKKKEVFDQNKNFIFLESKNSWPSELRNYILNPSYNAKAIGTYAYTEQDAKKEFYIEDVPELREKFPLQFEAAFVNWDYVVETYSKYLEDNK